MLTTAALSPVMMRVSRKSRSTVKPLYFVAVPLWGTDHYYHTREHCPCLVMTKFKAPVADFGPRLLCSLCYRATSASFGRDMNRGTYPVVS